MSSLSYKNLDSLRSSMKLPEGKLDADFKSICRTFLSLITVRQEFNYKAGNFSVKYLHLQQIFSNFAPESVVSCQETAVDCVNMTAKENINGGSKGLRGNRGFLATFNALYLAVPDILLTHTHTHTHTHTQAHRR